MAAAAAIKAVVAPVKPAPMTEIFFLFMLSTLLVIKHDYMFLISSSPNSEHFTSVAPSIRRAKS